MTPWSRKIQPGILSIFFIASFLFLATGFVRLAHADATPLGPLGNAKGYEELPGDFGEISPESFEDMLTAYPGVPFPFKLTATTTELDGTGTALEQGVEMTYSLTEINDTSMKIKVESDPTHDASKYDDLYLGVFIKKASDPVAEYHFAGATPYFHYNYDGGDAVKTSTIAIGGLEASTEYNIFLIGIYYYESFDIPDGHILQSATYNITTADVVVGAAGVSDWYGYSGGLGDEDGALNYTNGPDGEIRFRCDLLESDCNLVGGIFITPFGNTVIAELKEGDKEGPDGFKQAVQDSLKWGDQFVNLGDYPEIGANVTVTPSTSTTDVITGAEAEEGYAFVDILVTVKPTLSDGDLAIDEFDDAQLYMFYKLGSDPNAKIISFPEPNDWVEIEKSGEGVFQAYYPGIKLPAGKIWDFYMTGVYYYGDADIADGRIPPYHFDVDVPANGDILTDAEASEEGIASMADATVSGGFSPRSCLYDRFGDGKGLTILLPACFAQFFQHVTFPIVAGVVYITGKFFDIMANFSIGSSAYDSGVVFIQTGWTLVRDFSNILFIVALVYLAFGVIFDLHNVHVKKSIAAIIIMALLVNFSLFFTKMIIDTSNILARIFYTQIEITGTEEAPLTSSDLEEINISRGIVAGFDPQQMIGIEAQAKLQASLSDADQDRLIMILYLMATIMLAIAVWAFFVAGLNFLQRTISLWLAMIFAPFAFVSLAFPFGLKSIKRIGWSSWLKDLLCWCFYAPLFMFFIYLIILFADSGFLTSVVTGTESMFEYMVAIIFPFAVLITLLIYAKNLAKSLGCDGADAFVGAGAKLATGAAGIGIMVASGGVAALGRRTMGKSASDRLDKDEMLKKSAAGDAANLKLMTQGDGKKIKARKGYEGLSEVAAQKKAEEEIKRLQSRATGSYDVRQTKALGALSGALGINMNTGSGIANTITGNKIGFGTKETVGGYQAEADRRIKERQDFIKSLGIDHHEVEKQDKIIDNNKEGDKKSTDPLKQKAFEDIKDDRDKLLAIAAAAKHGGTPLTDEQRKDLTDLQTEASRRNKEIEKAERAKAKAEKGFTKTYADFLERNKDYRINSDKRTDDAAASFGSPNARRVTNSLKQALSGFVAGTLTLGPLAGSMAALTGAVNGLTDGHFLGSFRTLVNRGLSSLDSGKNIFSRFGDKNAVVDNHGKLEEVDKFVTDLSGMGMQEKIAKSLKDSHYHAGHYTDNYKPVMKEFFKFFENLSKGGKGGGGGGHSGGGGGHDGGHDDHGGGGHGGGHH